MNISFSKLWILVVQKVGRIVNDPHFFNKSLKNSDLSDSEYLKWQDRRKFDKECSVEQELMMLKKAGFKNPACIFSEGKFSVVVAQKQ